MTLKQYMVMVPEDLHTHFKVACSIAGDSMTSVIRTLMRAYIDSEFGKGASPIPEPVVEEFEYKHIKEQ